MKDWLTCPACDSKYIYREMNGTWVCTICANMWGLSMVADLDEA